MAVYPTSVNVFLWAPPLSDWVDITSNVVNDPIVCQWGINGNGPLDRIASTGSMSFTLNNNGGSFTPGGASALKRGLPAKLEIVYDGQTYVRFYGAVETVRIQAGTHGGRKIFVTVTDWMEQAARYILANPSVGTDKRADEVLTDLVAMMPIAPLATDYDTGTYTFPASFDSVTPSTVALSELAKLAYSEMGYIYLRKDKTHGETLCFENSQARHGWAWAGIAGTVGFPLTTIDDMVGMEVTYGDQLLNQLIVTAYPKYVDDVTGTPRVMYSLTSPMPIGAGQTIVFRAGYTDSGADSTNKGGTQVNVVNSAMVAPAATTDYLMNKKKDGTGTNITASLTVTAVYTTSYVEYTLYNNSDFLGYITKLKARGFGIYKYNSIQTVMESAASQALYGNKSLTIGQMYQQDVETGHRLGQRILDDNKQPEVVVQSVSFIANKSDEMMQAFLKNDVGDQVHIVETQSGVNGYFYIQGVRCEIALGGIIRYTWLVKQAFSLASGLSLLAVEFAAGTTDSVDFGYLPSVANLHQKSYSVWVYCNAPVSYGFTRTVMGNYIGVDTKGGAQLYVEPGMGTVNWLQDGTTALSNGRWRTDPLAVGVIWDTWMHIVVTRDSSTVTNYPVIYINGVSQTVTEDSAQLGADADETGNQFSLGNYDFFGGGGYVEPFDGKIADARVYDRILSAAEAASLYTNGAGGVLVTSGIVFQAFAVRANEYTDYVGKTLTAADKLIDNMYGAIGTPHGNPVGRAP